MLADYLKKVKARCRENKTDLILAFLIFLTGMGGFGLGRLSVLWVSKEPITVTEQDLGGSAADGQAQPDKTSGENPVSAITKGKYVGSKSGSSYHFPWCPGALKIKEENKIWFQTKQEAESRGYKPAANCSGL